MSETSQPLPDQASVAPAPTVSNRERRRRERVERLLGDIPSTTTAARMFHEQARAEATRLATRQ